MGILNKISSESRIAARIEGPRSNLIWVIPPFVVLGIVACFGFFSLGERFGGGVAVLGVLIIPPILIGLMVALRKALSLFNELRTSLRWWHGLWLLIFASALVFRVRGAGDIQQNPVDAWAVYRIGIEVLVCAILFLRLALRRTSWFGSMFRGFVGILSAFGVVELASSAWSVYPAWTLYKSSEFLLDVSLLAAVLATVQSAESYKDLFDCTWMLYGLLLVSVWVGVVLWPRQALYPQGFKVGLLGVWLTGVHPDVSANDVGTFAALLALIAVARLLPITGPKSNRSWYVLLLIASLVTMVLAQTRTAIAGFLFGFFLILLFSKRLGISAFLSFFVAPLLVLSSVGGLIWAFLERGETSRQLSTLSSRTVWWGAAWKAFWDRPLTGYGAYAGGRFAVLAKLGASTTSTMHSDYLEVIVGTGIWGMIPFLLALLGTWWFLTQYLRHSSNLTVQDQLAYEAIAVLGLLTLRSVFMTMLSWHPPLHYLAIVGYAEFLRRRRINEAPTHERNRGEARDSLLDATGGTQ